MREVAGHLLVRGELGHKVAQVRQLQLREGGGEVVLLDQLPQLQEEREVSVRDCAARQRAASRAYLFLEGA